MKFATLVITVAVALAAASQVQAAPRMACSASGGAGYVLVRYQHPFKFWLSDSYRSYPHRPYALYPTAPPPAGMLCGAAQAAWAHWQRFTVLYNRLGFQPTAAQWKAQWNPIVLQAIQVDEALLTVEGPAGGNPGSFTEPGAPAAQANIRADLAWLHAHLHTGYGKRVA